MKILRLTIYLMTILTCFWQKGLCQKKIDVDPDSTIIRNLPDLKKVPFIDFLNLNKIPYYYQKKELQRIEQYRSAGDHESLYPALFQYISNFGIQNFYKDTPLLWELATLAEKLGKKEESVELYKLVLKHHRQDINIQKIKQQFDSIQGSIKDQYVSIDYYYELVDYRKEVDRKGTYGSSGVLVEKIMQPREILTGALVSFTLAGAVGLYFIVALPKGVFLLWPVLIGGIFGFFYTGIHPVYIPLRPWR